MNPILSLKTAADRSHRAGVLRPAFVSLVVAVAVLWTLGSGVVTPAWSADAEGLVDQADIASIMNDQPDESAAPAGAMQPGIDLYSLILRGGLFMIPIALMSMLVVSLAVERLLALRKSNVIPRRLVSQLSTLVDDPRFDPEAAFQACQNHPSAAANVIRSMLLRTGQPLGQVERTAGEAVQREADQYAGPIRWLNLAAAATPLMGLLGTVWGMIVAFHQSSTLAVGQSRSEQLSEGIYTALVTTLAGLIVAIPAAIFAQYLENRITKLFHRIELLAFEVAPGLQRFSGKRQLAPSGRLVPLELKSSSGAERKSAVKPPPVSRDATDSPVNSGSR